MRKTSRATAIALAVMMALPVGAAASPLLPAIGLSGAAATLDSVELVKNGGGKGGKAFKAKPAKAKHFKVKHAGKHHGFHRVRYARRGYHRSYHRSRIVYGVRSGYHRRGHLHCHRHYRYGGIRHCHWHRGGHH
jgi:hypothetical protein